MDALDNREKLVTGNGRTTASKTTCPGTPVPRRCHLYRMAVVVQATTLRAFELELFDVVRISKGIANQVQTVEQAPLGNTADRKMISGS